MVNYLRSAVGLLDFEQNPQLQSDTLAICDYLANPSFRIAVFGPFNYGKSTLLNALLGNRILPIDLIPTTGAAIRVQYGNELRTRISLLDGTEISESGTEVLKQFAILDDERRMHSDVAQVEVFCPHPFLQTGVELLDLPGTNDREAQDALVRDKLLTADLVVQVLDARKLMTLGEREHLRDWLIDRGIKTVVFVVNFLNLLSAEEQKQIYNRLLFVAESFRAELPGGISNLYRVDALPALRAKLKGDTSAVQATGLSMFESALQTIVAVKEQKMAVALPRVVAIATRVKQALQAKIQALATELSTTLQKHAAKIEIQKKAEKLIKPGFQASLSDFQSWLYLPKLLSRYQSEIATELQQGRFNTWESEQFKPAVLEYEEAIVEWVNKGCEFFQREHPGKLSISFPDAPQVAVPNSSTSSKKSSDGDVAPVAIATGLGWVLGGPVGAAVIGGMTYLLNQNSETEKPESSSADYLADAASDYLTRFSTQAVLTLSQYEEKAEKTIIFLAGEDPLEVTSQQQQLQLLNTLLENLNRELENPSINPIS